jgi:hypothetical protein
MASVLTGQNALQQLPCSGDGNGKPKEDSLASYHLDSNLQTLRKSLSTSTEVGVEVLKVSRVSASARTSAVVCPLQILIHS